MDICSAVLEYLARPENVKKVCEASGKRSALKDINPDLGEIAEDYKTYADIRICPVFDRA